MKTGLPREAGPIRRPAPLDRAPSRAFRFAHSIHMGSHTPCSRQYTSTGRITNHVPVFGL